MKQFMVKRFSILILTAIVMLLAGMAYSLVQKKELSDKVHQVLASQTIATEVEHLLSLAKDMETGQRGYLITGDPSYLEPFNAARAELDERLLLVLKLTEDNDEMQRSVVSMSNNLALKIAELQRTIQLRRDVSFEAAKDVVATDEGKFLMEKIREDAKSILDYDHEKLRQELIDMEQTSTSSTQVLVITIILALLTGVSGVALLFHSNRLAFEGLQLSLEKQKAEESNHAKSEFLATMSHEIRTPMNAILGFSELLSTSVTSPKDRQHVEAIHSSGKVLLSLINDVLDLSKIEAGKLEIVESAEDVRRFATSIQTLFSLQARERNLTFSVEVDDQVPDYLIIDHLRVRQVLVNLIGNALKFTREGGVYVRFSVGDLSGSKCTLRISVRDSGVGIAEGQREEIFDRFYQVDSGRTRDAGGTGLGLSISQKLAHLMDGEITFESEEGKGSTFTVSFQGVPRSTGVSPAKVAVRDEVDFSIFSPSRILVVDDVELNRELLRNILLGHGHTIVEAENGQIALEKARLERPDLVLMDIRMPVMDGYTAREEMENDATLRRIPVVAVTASSLLQTESRILIEFDGFLRKPFNRKELHGMISRYLQHKEGQQQKFRSEDQDGLISTNAHLRKSPRKKLSLEEKARLFKELGDFQTELTRLRKLLPAQESVRFANQLFVLAEEFYLEDLKVAAERIYEKADQFEIDDLAVELASLETILEHHLSSESL